MIEKFVDAHLSNLVQEVYASAIVYKIRTTADDDPRIAFKNFLMEIADVPGNVQIVMLGQDLKEAKRSTEALVKAFRARSKRVQGSATALDPFCKICGILDCQTHRQWRSCVKKNHVVYWDPSQSPNCIACSLWGNE